MRISLKEVVRLCDDLEAESKKLAQYNSALVTLLREMKIGWKDDDKFPEYEKNIRRVIDFNDETITELTTILGKANTLKVKIANRLAAK